MSELLKKIKTDQVVARKAGNKEEATVLTTLLGESSPSGFNTIDDIHVQSVIKKFLKNLHDTLNYTTNPEVRVRIQNEISVLERYMPAQLSEDQLRDIISEIIAGFEKQGIKGSKGIGMVMKELSAHHDGQYDGKTASTIVKEMV